MTHAPFILLDDARAEGASDARLYEDVLDIVIARRADEVEAALARIASMPGNWAGYLAYEAGLALEKRLAPLAAERTGAAGPLVWFARFGTVTRLASADVECWLANNSTGSGRLGPMGAAISSGGYAKAFNLVQEAIRAGDIYQANLTFPLAGTWLPPRHSARSGNRTSRACASLRHPRGFRPAWLPAWQ